MAACGGADSTPTATQPSDTPPVATTDPTTTAELADAGSPAASTTVAPATTVAPTTTAAPTTTLAPSTTAHPTTVADTNRAGPEQLDWVLDWSAELTFTDGGRVTVTHTGPFQITTEPGKAGQGRELVGLTSGSISGVAVVTGTGDCRAETPVSATFDGTVGGTWYPGDVFELVVEVSEVRDAKDISTDCGGFLGALAEDAYRSLGSIPGSEFLPPETRTVILPGPVSVRYDEEEPHVHSTISVAAAGG